jgi:hypothetical protein
MIIVMVPIVIVVPMVIIMNRDNAAGHGQHQSQEGHHQ